MQEQLDFKFTRNIPSEWETRLQRQRDGPHPLFWWRVQLMRYIWRFKPSVQQILDDRRASIIRDLKLDGDMKYVFNLFLRSL